MRSNFFDKKKELSAIDIVVHWRFTSSSSSLSLVRVNFFHSQMSQKTAARKYRTRRVINFSNTNNTLATPKVSKKWIFCRTKFFTSTSLKSCLAKVQRVECCIEREIGCSEKINMIKLICSNEERWEIWVKNPSGYVEISWWCANITRKANRT